MGIKSLLSSFWGGAAEPPARDEPVERFGRTFVKHSRGVKLLENSSKRKGWCQAIRDHINLDSKYSKKILIDRVLVRFALFVGDLPASDKDHDSGPYGLLNHSLEIAWQVVMELTKPGFKPSPDPVAADRERPGWVYAGFLAALLHDVGKVFDVEVNSGKGEGGAPSAIWNPRVQPLVAFLESRGLKAGHPENEHANFRRGRGRGTHERIGALLHAVVLPPSVVEFAGLPFTQVVASYMEKGVNLDNKHLPEGARRVSEIICHKDGRHQEQTRETKRQAQASTESKPKPERDEALGSTTQAKEPSSSKPVPKAGGSALRPAPMKRDSESDTLMEPRALLEAVGLYIGSGQMMRNTNTSAVFIQPDWTWLLFPRFFTDVLIWNQIVYKPKEHPTQILKALSLSGQAFEQAPGSPKTLIRLRPELGQGKWAVGIKTSAFSFPPELLKSLGFWPYEIGHLKPTTAAFAAIETASVA